MDTLVAVLMASDPLTVGPEVLVRDAVRIVIDRGISHLLVTERDDLVGLVCVCDLDQASTGASVGECMSREPITVDPQTRATEAARIMLERKVGCLPVLAGDRLAGVLTLGDLRRAGVIDLPVERCIACGSKDHVRCERSGRSVGYCLECTRRSEPPGPNDDLGGG